MNNKMEHRPSNGGSGVQVKAEQLQPRSFPGYVMANSQSASTSSQSTTTIMPPPSVAQNNHRQHIPSLHSNGFHAPTNSNMPPPGPFVRQPAPAFASTNGFRSAYTTGVPRPPTPPRVQHTSASSLSDRSMMPPPPAFGRQHISTSLGAATASSSMMPPPPPLQPIATNRAGTVPPSKRNSDRMINTSRSSSGGHPQTKRPKIQNTSSHTHNTAPTFAFTRNIKTEPQPEIKIKQEEEEDDFPSNTGNIDNDSPSTEETHIILTIDFSSSMKKKDVITGSSGGGGGGRKKKKSSSCGWSSRWDAVFACTKTLLEDQIDKKTDDTKLLVSLVVFNDDAKTLVKRMPLTNSGGPVFNALERARTENSPHGGTGFSAGFGRAKRLADEAPIGSNVVVVFLSDGRPGDLKATPPKSASKDMQPTFRRKKCTLPSAGVHINDMKQRHGDRFSLQIVCIVDEGKPWLNYIANRFNGYFHNPDLSLQQQNDYQQQSYEDNDDSDYEDNDDSDYEDDGDSDYEDDGDNDSVQVVKVKSQTTMLRERFNKARSAGNVLSIPGTATNGRTSMQDTFMSISSSITSLRNGSSKPKQERQVVVGGWGTKAMRSFEATKMVLDIKSGKWNTEKDVTRKVRIAQQPFAQGGLRNVYRIDEIMKNGSIRKFVAKESRHEVPYSERLRFHCETSTCQARAIWFAREFNKQTRRKNLDTKLKDIMVLRASCYRLNDPSAPGKFRYLAVEDQIHGTYHKWNGNNGYINPDEMSSPAFNVAQAFSHFTFEKSGMKEMVVDIQGSDFRYTDPQLHSKSKEYGRADRGERGFHDFFRTHKCNSICCGLNLKNRTNYGS